MAFRDLQAFIDALDKAGELRRIAVPVDPILEITEIADRVMKAEGPALLFERPIRGSMPLAINLFGTRRRMELALGVTDLDEIAARIEGLITPPEIGSLWDKIKTLPKLAELGSMFPKSVTRAPCQEIVERDHPSLADLPILTCWPEDGGPYITLPLVITRSPDTGRRNVGMYRLQVFDDQTLGMHWQIHKGGADHQREAQAANSRIPVAIALGADPATMYAATAPLPPGVDELLFAGFLRREPVEVVRCVTNDLEVPAHADVVLEGYVDPQERRIEGPFGDHQGFYSLPDEYPVFHLTALTRRTHPIYPTTIVGRPPMEDYWLGKATERIFLPLLRMQLPELVDMNFPAEGIFHNCVLVSMRKSFPGHARKLMHALWGLGQMIFTKLIVVVDHDVNVQNLSEVAWKALSHIDAKRDVVIVDGPVDALDFAAPSPCVGGKMGIDATRKWSQEGMPRPWPPEMAMSPAVKALVDGRWAEYGIDGRP